MNNSAKPNEPLVTHIYTADPSAHVYEGKLYIYPSHDLDLDIESNDNGDQYMMEDYHVLSMDSIDSPCVDNGEALNIRDIPWASVQLWLRMPPVKMVYIICTSLSGTKKANSVSASQPAKTPRDLSFPKMSLSRALSV
jgi:hypothetical protein